MNSLSTLHRCCLHRQLRSLRAHRPPPIDPFKQHRKLCWCQRHRSIRCLWPNKSPALQSFREKTKSVAIEPQNLDQVPAPTTKNINLTRKRIFLKRRLHHPAQPCESASPVRPSGDAPNPRPCRQPNHRSKCSSTIRSASPSTLPETQTCPLGKST